MPSANQEARQVALIMDARLDSIGPATKFASKILAWSPLTVETHGVLGPAVIVGDTETVEHLLARWT
jgi:hypothetical protein